MPEFRRLSGTSIDIQLEFVEREQTPRELIQLSIQLQLRGLSLSATVLESFGVERARSTVHNWVEKADLQPTDGTQPDHVALDETVIHLDDQRYWLYAAVDPETYEFLHGRLFPTRNTGITKRFLQVLRENHDGDAEFLVDSGSWLTAALHDLHLRFRHETHGNRNAVERASQEVKRRTDQLGNCFRNAEPATVET